MDMKPFQSLIVPVLLLAGCRAASSTRLPQTEVVAWTAPARPASPVVSPNDVLGSWLVHDYRSGACDTPLDAVVKFNADGTYEVESAADHVPLGGGSFRLVRSHLVLESEGCFWPPANRLHHCTGVYTVSAVRRGGVPVMLTFDLVRDKDDPERAMNLHAVSLFRIVH